jgi:hypothetical protein
MAAETSLGQAEEALLVYIFQRADIGSSQQESGEKIENF